MSQRFEHDCDVCRFVGQLGPEDVWIHERNASLPATTVGNNGTLIRRWGNDGPEYSSMPVEMLPKLRSQHAPSNESVLWVAALILAELRK